MTKRMITLLFSLLAVLVLATFCCASAEEDAIPVTEGPIPVTGGSKKSEAAPIDCGRVYESVGTTKDDNTFTSFYQFKAPADEICTISFEVEKLYYYYSDLYENLKDPLALLY